MLVFPAGGLGVGCKCGDSGVAREGDADGEIQLIGFSSLAQEGGKRLPISDSLNIAQLKASEHFEKQLKYII